MRLSAVLALLAAMTASSSADVFDNKTVDRIVGSEIKEDEATAATDEAQVLAAIEKTAENISAVRKTTSVKQVDIVFLTDVAPAEGGPPRKLAKAINEHKAEIAKLRQEIEGNALLYHAINSRRVLIPDVLAVEFRQSGKVVIYAAANPPG